MSKGIEAGRGPRAFTEFSSPQRAAEEAPDPVASYLGERFPGFTPGPDWAAVTSEYPAMAPAEYLDLIANPSPQDPVFAQAAPDRLELEPGVPDPIGEEIFSPLPGLIHRYPDRVLVMPTSQCFVRCRHCMRKRTWKAGLMADRALLEKWRGYLAARPGIREVIISGGDPLTLSEARLGEILEAVGKVPHLEKVRIHSRALVACPSRISPSLARMLGEGGVTRLVTQINHPVEAGARTARAAEVLANAGIGVYNQSVLLRGINDRTRVLAGLFSAVSSIGVRPYYLHHPDPVQGALHFRIGLIEGWRVFSAAAKLTAPGAVPEYVVDLPGETGKARVKNVILAGKSFSRTLPEADAGFR